MIRTALAHLRAQWMGALALFLVIGGGTAYAANTVFSTDIVNGEVKSVDIGNGEVTTADIGNNQVRGADVGPDQLNGSDVADQGLSGVDLLDSSVSSLDLATNSVGPEEVLDGAIGSEEIGDGAIGSGEVGDGAIRSAEVADGLLRGADLGEAQFVQFDANLPQVGSQTCVSAPVTGLPGNPRDHLLLTESTDTTRPWIFTQSAYSTTAGQMVLRTCNLAAFTEPAGTHRFNLLVINAQ